MGWGMLGLRCWGGTALVCGPLVPGLCLIYTPHLFAIAPLTSIDPQLTYCHSFDPTHSQFVLIGPHVPSVDAYSHSFDLVCPWCTCSPLFAPAAAVPAVCTTAHMCALTLALGSCVPTLHTSLLFVAPYL